MIDGSMLKITEKYELHRLNNNILFSFKHLSIGEMGTFLCWVTRLHSCLTSYYSRNMLVSRNTQFIYSLGSIRPVWERITKVYEQIILYSYHKIHYRQNFYRKYNFFTNCSNLKLCKYYKNGLIYQQII